MLSQNLCRDKGGIFLFLTIFYLFSIKIPVKQYVIFAMDKSYYVKTPIFDVNLDFGVPY
jgi:hypothetical protein